MPHIKTIKGVKIEVRYREGKHSVPHFHAVYQSYDASISIETLEILEGKLPVKKMKEVLYFAVKNRKLLLKVWNKAKGKK